MRVHKATFNFSYVKYYQSYLHTLFRAELFVSVDVTRVHTGKCHILQRQRE